MPTEIRMARYVPARPVSWRNFSYDFTLSPTEQEEEATIIPPPMWTNESNYIDEEILRRLLELGLPPDYMNTLNIKPPPKLPAPERTDGMSDNVYFQITDKTLMVYNWFNPESPHKISYRFSLEELRQPPEVLEDVVKQAVNEFRQRYGTSQALDEKVKTSFMGISIAHKEVFLNVQLPELSLDWLLNKLNNGVNALENAISEARRYAEQYIVVGRADGLAEYMYRGQECKIKLIMLNEVINAIKALKEGVISEAYLTDHSSIIDYCVKSLDSFAVKSNNGQSGRNAKDNETKWQYQLSSLKKRRGEDTVHAVNHRSEIINITNARQERMRGDRGAIRLTKFKPDIKSDFKLSLNVLYPTLKAELKRLSHDLRYGSRLTPEHGVHIDSHVLHHYWDRFNNIKIKLMFLGFSEAKSVKLLCSAFRCPMAMCEMTKQWMPESLLVPVVLQGPKDHDVIRANAYYLHSLNGNGDMRRRRFDFGNPSAAVEQKIQAQDYYHSAVKNHTYNPLTFLSPRSMSDENVRVYGNNRTFRPVPYMGVELEVERKEGYRNDPSRMEPVPACDEDVTERVYDLLGRDFVLLKRDGSLGGHLPFEIVTAPATLQYHQMRWKRFLEDSQYKNMLQSYHSGNCGMHVHISRDSFNGLHLAKFMRFMNLKDNYAFVTKVAQRAGNRYSVFAEQSLKEHLNLIHGPERMGRDEARRVAVNCTNSSTIEVRIFRGNLSKIAFLKNLEFVHAVWAFTKDASIADLNYKKFLFWLFDTNNDTKFYKHLKVWLVSAGYNVSNIRVVNAADAQKAKKAKKMQLIVDRKYKPDSPTVKFGGRTPVNKEEILASA